MGSWYVNFPLSSKKRVEKEKRFSHLWLKINQTGILLPQFSLVPCFFYLEGSKNVPYELLRFRFFLSKGNKLSTLKTKCIGYTVCPSLPLYSWFLFECNSAHRMFCFCFFFLVMDLALVQYNRTDLFVVTFVWVVFLFVRLLFPTREMLKVVKLLFWSVDKTDKFLLWPYSYTTNTLSFITYCNTLCEKGIYLHVLSKLSLLVLDEDGTI